ncbi:MAG: hypothetical protein ABL861_01860 [Nitrosomonas sp.]
MKSIMFLSVETESTHLPDEPFIIPIRPIFALHWTAPKTFYGLLALGLFRQIIFILGPHVRSVNE